MRRLTDLPIVEVHWRDASLISKWQTHDDAHGEEPVECRTVGRLIKVTRRHYTLTMTIESQGQVTGTFIIPKDWVGKMVVLRKGKG